MGAIGNYWARPHRVSDEDLRILQALADATSVALENVRAYASLEQSEARMGRPIGIPERMLLRSLLDDGGPALHSVSEATSGHPVSFYIAPGFDVYPTFMAVWPAYRLGNLKTDGVAGVLDTYEQDRTRGLQAMFHTPTCELARRFGRRYGRRLYDSGDLQWRWASLLAKSADES